MHPFHLMLALFAALALVAFGFFIRFERAQFHRKGKGGAWLAVRLATIPIAMVTAAALMVPTRSISGMEALGVFYILLFTAAPILWFVLHWIVGKMVKPRLTFGESALIAITPIMFAIGTAIVAQQLQGIAWVILRSMGYSG